MIAAKSYAAGATVAVPVPASSPPGTLQPVVIEYLRSPRSMSYVLVASLAAVALSPVLNNLLSWNPILTHLYVALATRAPELSVLY